MRKLSLFIFSTLLIVTSFAAADGVRCEHVFGERRKLTAAETKLFNEYWEAQWYLFTKAGGLVDANPDPRFTRIDIGPYSDLVTEVNPRLRSVSIEDVKATQAQWGKLLQAKAYEDQNLVLSIDDVFQNPYTRAIVGVETKSPADAPLAALLPAELKTKYPKLMMPRYRFLGENKAEQSVDVGVHLAFSALRSLIVRKEGTGELSPADQKLLNRIFFDGSEMKPIRFAGEKEMNFSPEPASPHRLALTGDDASSPIIFNRDRLKELIETRKMSLADLAGLIVHELTHHRGLKDDEKRTPDRMGALVTKMIAEASETIDISGDGKTRLHLYKWGYRPKVFRHSEDTTTFSVILEDGGMYYNLTSYVKQILKQGDARLRTSLFTLRDFDVDVLKTKTPAGTSYEMKLNFHQEVSLFDMERYKRETGLDPAALEKGTPEQVNAWYDQGMFANPKYQIKGPSQFADLDIVFNTDANGGVKLNSLLVIPGHVSPADVSAASSQLTDFKVLKTEGKKITASVLLKDFDLPEGYQLHLVARAKDLDEPPMVGPVNRVPLFVTKPAKTADGLLLEFVYDDSISLATRDLSIDGVYLIGHGMASISKTATAVDFKLPPRILRPDISINAMEIHRDDHGPQPYGFAFRVAGLTHLQEAKLFVEVTTLVDLNRYERHLMEIDLMKLNDPKARDAWSHEWLGNFEARVLGDQQQVFRVGIDPSAFNRTVQNVRLHSIFVKDVDLRRQFVMIPEQPSILNLGKE